MKFLENLTTLKSKTITTRSLWTILIKIMGIWFVLDSIRIIYSYLTYLLLAKSGEELRSVITAMGIVTLFVFFFFLVLYLCLFKTHWIIDKFKLDKGFLEEKFELNMHRSSIYAISIIVIGGLLLIRSFPELCRLVIVYFHQNSAGTPTWSYILLHFVQTIIGIYFISGNRTIVNFVERQRKKSTREG